jgi:sugar lactone lactonase YvrE
VDEMPGLWKGRNLFVVKGKGNLASSRTLKKFTVEPEDLAMDNRHRSLYVTDDDLDRVFKDKAGKDGLFGTRDDVAVTVLHTRRFGSFDPEGLTWLPQKKMLIVSDSTTRRIYKIRQGKDRKFGTRDDVIRSFGVHRYGFTTAEDVVATRFTHHLLIVSSRQRFILETTMKGALVRKIDLTSVGVKAASGITFAPGTDGSKSRLYLTDSGVDNNVNPGENDGRLFELKIVP